VSKPEIVLPHIDKAVDEFGMIVPDMFILSYVVTAKKWLYVYYSHQYPLGYLASSSHGDGIIVNDEIWKNDVDLRKRHREAAVYHAKSKYPINWTPTITAPEWADDTPRSHMFVQRLKKDMEALGLMAVGGNRDDDKGASTGRRVVISM
jgi:hypothetical protein